MAFSTMLDIVAAASAELGLPVPATVVGNTSNNAIQARQMLALLNSAGRSLVRVHDWSSLLTLNTITTVASTSDYAMPTGFDRMVSETFWDENEQKRLGGPDNPQNDRARRSGLVQPSILKIFRQIGKTYMRIYPTPTTVQTLSYEYVSGLWVDPSSGANTALFAADDDVPLFDADLMVKDLKWRFMAAKGMDTTVFLAEWRTLLDQLIASDLGGSTLNMGGARECQEGEVTADTQPSYILGEGGDYIAWN